jgi:hypothetical protein
MSSGAFSLLSRSWPNARAWGKMPTSTVETKERPQNAPVVFVALRWIRVVLLGIVLSAATPQNAKAPQMRGFDCVTAGLNFT